MSTRIKPYDKDIEKIVKCSFSNYTDQDKKNRFEYYIPQIIKNENNFKITMISSIGEQFNQEFVSNLNITREMMEDDMIDLYTSKFSKVGQPGRKYYDKIKILIEYCPYCQNNDVKHLDHFLPKTEVPLLSVSPLNLVPLCSDCNTAKKVTTGFFNPYFDDVDSEKYLFCSILFNNNEFFLEFKAIKPERWSTTQFKKVESVFTKMTSGHQILLLFNKWARTTINESKRNLISSAKRGELDFRDTLTCSYKDAKEFQGINYWKSALYKGLLENFDETYNYFKNLII